MGRLRFANSRITQVAAFMFCSLFSTFHIPLYADDKGVLTDKKSQLQAPVADKRLQALRVAILSADPKQVALFFHFPLNVMTTTASGTPQLEQITTVAEFIQRYPQLVSPLQQQFLSCLTPAQLTFDGFDYSALAGQFWLRDFSQYGKRDFYISTISQDEALIAPWLSANCQNSDKPSKLQILAPVDDELGIIAAEPSLVTTVNSSAVEPALTSVKGAQPVEVPSLGAFKGQSELHRIEITEMSAGKWRYQSWLLTQTAVKPALEIIGAKVLAAQGPILQFKRGKYRYRFIGPNAAVTKAEQPAGASLSRLEIYYNEQLIRTEMINVQ
jgi:hypothetical protein